MKQLIIFLLLVTSTLGMLSCKGSNKQGKFIGDWTRVSQYPPLYCPKDGTSITDIRIIKNGDNFVVSLNPANHNDTEIAQADQSNNLMLFGGTWVLALDANNNDNMFVAGQVFRRK